MEETWASIPELTDYEISSHGRVRKWMRIRGKSSLRIYRGIRRGSDTVFHLQGGRYTSDELVQAAFGDAGEPGYDPRDIDRELTDYEVSEIRSAEGWKPAFSVAEEFRIESRRVRDIWDGGR